MSLLRYPGQQHNQLLAALPRPSWDRLASRFRRVQLQAGDVIYEPGERPDNLYFPESSLISMLYTLASGHPTEVAMVGADGVVGLSMLLSGVGSTNRAVVASAGLAISIGASALRTEFTRGGALQRILLRYTQTLLA